MLLILSPAHFYKVVSLFRFYSMFVFRIFLPYSTLFTCYFVTQEVFLDYVQLLAGAKRV